MLKEKYFKYGIPDMLISHHLLSDEEKYSQVLSELADLHIEPVKKTKTNAGHFAMELSTLYDKDVIVIKEGVPKTGSVALVFWKEWNKFSFIKYKNSRAIYTLVNHDFDYNVTKIMIEKFNRIMSYSIK